MSRAKSIQVRQDFLFEVADHCKAVEDSVGSARDFKRLTLPLFIPFLSVQVIMQEKFEGSKESC